MKKLLCLPILLIGVSLLQAGETGAPLPLTNGSVDGWSGVTVLNGAGSIPAGESVSTVTYYAEASRASGEHHVQPLILKNVDGVAEIWGIGPVSNATDAGENSVSWGSDAIPDDGNDEELEAVGGSTRKGHRVPTGAAGVGALDASPRSDYWHLTSGYLMRLWHVRN